MEDPHSPSVRLAAGCGRALLSRYPHCTHDLHRQVQRELGTADCFPIRHPPIEEGGRELQGHLPLHPTSVGSMGAQGIRGFSRRHGGQKPSAEADVTAAGDGEKCAEGLCLHANIVKSPASRPLGHWLGKSRPPPPN